MYCGQLSNGLPSHVIQPDTSLSPSTHQDRYGDVWRPTPSVYELAYTNAVHDDVAMHMWINLYARITANLASFSRNPKSRCFLSHSESNSRFLAFSIYFSVGCTCENAQNFRPTHTIEPTGKSPWLST